MKRFARLLVALTLPVALAAALLPGFTAWGQAPQAAPPTGVQKTGVQGYTRINKKTGQPVQIRPYKRRLPLPKAVEVRSYFRKGMHVMGYQRRRPGEGKP